MNDTSFSNPFDNDDKANRGTILLVSLGVVLLCCGFFAVGALLWLKPDPQALIAQYFPSTTLTASPTLTRTPTPVSTSTNTPSPTPNLTATAEIVQVTDTAAAFQSTATNAAGTWNVVLTDAFDSNKNKWLNENADDEFANVNYQIVDGKYRWDVTTHKSFIGWVRAGKNSFTDFYVSFDVQQTSGPETADYGVIFRETKDGNFYYFGINSSSQTYALYEYIGEWNTLIALTETDLLKQDEPNRVTVIGEGPQFSFFINDQFLASVTDEQIAKGSIALGIEMAQAGDEAVVEFDNFELRTP
jgi:hypothetical protein